MVCEMWHDVFYACATVWLPFTLFVYEYLVSVCLCASLSILTREDHIYMLACTRISQVVASVGQVGFGPEHFLSAI